MADVIHQLLAIEDALDKLGARGISIREAEQLLRNRHAIVCNLRGHPDRPQRGERRLLIGLTDGNRAITLAVQATIEPITWLLITGWGATAVEHKLIENLRSRCPRTPTPTPAPATSTTSWRRSIRATFRSSRPRPSER